MFTSPAGVMSWEARSEVKLREAVAELNLDTPLIRSFLNKTAKEYLKVFGKKGKVVKINAPHFIFEVSAPNWRRRVRVPVTDFFAGKSTVAQRDYNLRQLLKGAGKIVSGAGSLPKKKKNKKRK